MKKFTIYNQVLISTLLLFLSANMVFSQPPSHDPSHMVKDGGRYWIFTTGNGIWNMSSPDNTFNSWRAESLVLEYADKPTWIQSYVPGFSWNYWAPDLIFMNGKWYLYYSCSTFGSQNSAIGLVTTPSISDSAWTDQGMVVYSDNTWNVNAIDPAPFKDQDGKVWLIYGSFWNGIVSTEIDSITGKPLDPHNLHYLANNQCEAGNMLYHDGFYYLFFNRGACCRGINSTYMMLMGRSESPIGPFYDKNSVSTNSNGGSVFIHSDGMIIGPGHFGYGENKLTCHYYDGGFNGDPKLMVAELTWKDGWPVAVYNRKGALQDSIYVVTNYNSKKVLEIAHGDTISGTNIIQNTVTMDTIQHWAVRYVGDGYYKLNPVLAPFKAMEVQDCSTTDGANVQIGTYDSLDCQQWYLVNMGNNIFRIMSQKSYRALEVAGASTTDSANVRQRSFNQNQTAQRWTFGYPTERISAVPSEYANSEIKIFPNPAHGNFSIELGNSMDDKIVSVEIFSADGRQIYHNQFQTTHTIILTAPLGKGLYLVKITAGKKVMNQMLLIN